MVNLKENGADDNFMFVITKKDKTKNFINYIRF